MSVARRIFKTSYFAVLKGSMSLSENVAVVKFMSYVAI
jgi:hypothetical protein